MRRAAFILATSVVFLSASGACLAGGKARNSPVYRVDSVTARVTGRKLTISAVGAVRTGGWENPHLKVLPQHGAEPGTLIVKFLASPPPKGAAVIQALLPVSAVATVKLPRYATSKVTVKAETNEASAIIQTKK